MSCVLWSPLRPAREAIIYYSINIVIYIYIIVIYCRYNDMAFLALIAVLLEKRITRYAS